MSRIRSRVTNKKVKVVGRGIKGSRESFTVDANKAKNFNKRRFNGKGRIVK